MNLISLVLDRFLNRENRIRLGLNRLYMQAFRITRFVFISIRNIDAHELRLRVRSYLVRNSTLSLSSPGFQVLKWLGPVGLSLRLFVCRWNRKNLRTVHIETGLDACDVYFINLKHRGDRLKALEEQYKKVGIANAIRVDARRHTNGALGCSMSHLDVLSHYESNASRLLMICEDDCEFLANREELSEIITEFQMDNSLDVLCLAFNTTKPNQVLNLKGSLRITADTQTTACYILKAHMVQKMMVAALESVSGLERTGDSTIFAIDIVWKKLQAKYLFAIPKKRAVVQTESFSDIEKKHTNYGV